MAAALAGEKVASGLVWLLHGLSWEMRLNNGHIYMHM